MLKDLLNAHKSTGRIIPLLDKGILKEGAEDTQKRRRDCFHPSDITQLDFCPRAWVLGALDPSLYMNRAITAKQYRVFGVGHAVHDMMQRHLGLTGKLFGEWVCHRWCMEERCTWIGFKPDGRMCPMNCPHKAKWGYSEVRVVDEKLNVGGHTDGIVVQKCGKDIFEFKTMRHDLFTVVAQPLDIHVLQALVYLEVLEREKFDLARRVELQAKQCGSAELRELSMQALDVVAQKFSGVVLVYMDKDTQELKEFFVKSPFIRSTEAVRVKGDGDPVTTESEHVKALTQVYQTIREAQRHFDESTLPERCSKCTSKSSPRARKCFAKNACFAGEE